MSGLERRLLIIAENEEDYVLLCNLLAQNEPYVIEWAATYEAAFSAISQKTCDVCLANVYFGGRMSLDLVHEAQQHGSATPFILLAEQENNEREAMIQAGAADYLIKHELSPPLLKRAIDYAIERRQMAHALSESEYLYHSLVELSPDAIAVHASGKLLYLNAAGKVLFAVSSDDDYLGHSILDFIHPDYVDLVIERVRKTSEEGVSGDLIEEKMIRLDGQVIDVEVANAPTTYKGQPAIQVVVRDIAYRKQAEATMRESEARLQNVYDHSPVMMHSVDEDGRIINVNQKWLEEMGYTRQEVIGQQIVALMTPESALQAATMMAQLWRDGSMRDVACQFVKKDGTVIDILLDSNTTTDPGGQRSSLCVVRNITAQKRATEERERLIAELDAFAHTVAHDLKNPLQMIIGYVDLLRESQYEILREEAHAYVRRLWKTSAKMRNIIEELLLFASVRQMDQFEVVPLNMARIIYETQQRLAYLIEEANAVIFVPETWPSALGYDPWIEEVWVNYISNGLKYGGLPHQPPHLTLGATPLPDGMVRFWIKDDGPGLTAEEQADLFVPFKQLDQVRTMGHGLGLSIVRRIVERLGGEVGIESAPGEGSTFYFTLVGNNAET